MRNLTRIRTIAIILALGSCNIARGQFSEYGPTAHLYVQAAARGDFATVEAMSSDSTPIRWMRLVVETEPELLQAAATEGLGSLGGVVRNDTVFVRFGFRYQGRTEVLSFRFVERGQQRLISNVALPDRV